MLPPKSSILIMCQTILDKRCYLSTPPCIPYSAVRKLRGADRYIQDLWNLLCCILNRKGKDGLNLTYLASALNLTQPSVIWEGSLNWEISGIKLSCGGTFVGELCWSLIDIESQPTVSSIIPWSCGPGQEKLVEHEPGSKPASNVSAWFRLQVPAWIPALTSLSDRLWPGRVSQISPFLP